MVVGAVPLAIQKTVSVASHSYAKCYTPRVVQWQRYHLDIAVYTLVQFEQSWITEGANTFCAFGAYTEKK